MMDTAPMRTLAETVAAFEHRGDRIALVAVAREHRWTFAELASAVRRLAWGLVAHGMEREEPVALYAANRPEWVVAALAVIIGGGVPVPLDPMAPIADLRHALIDSGTRRVITSADRMAAVTEALAGADPPEIILLDDGIDQTEGRDWRSLLADTPRPLPDLRADDRAVLFYTSGTTGTPKGVPLTHRNLTADIDGFLGMAPFGATERVLLPLPLHHVYPFTVGMLVPLSIGARIIFPAGLTGPQIAEALRRERATVVIGVPRLYTALVAAIRDKLSGSGGAAGAVFERALRLCIAARRRRGWRLGRVLFAPIRHRVAPDLRLLASGGAHLDPDLAWMLEGLGWRVLSGYGLTETSPIIAFNAPDRSRIGTVGHPLPGVEVRIADPDRDGIGEIQVRGPTVFAGYHNIADATGSAFTADGWFHTGDLGRLDADGYLIVTGRATETIVLSGGKKIFPEEVERVYAEDPLIREIAVLDHGGRLVGLVVAETERLAASHGTDRRAAIRAALRERSGQLPAYRRIADFALSEQPLPRTPIGKLKRHRLPALYEQVRQTRTGSGPQILSDTDRALLDRGRTRAVWDWLRERYADRTPSLDSDLRLDIGLDSLDWITLTLELERRFQVRIGEEAVEEMETVRDLLHMVAMRSAVPAAGADGDMAMANRLSPEQERWIRPSDPLLRGIGFVMYACDRMLFRIAFPVQALGVDHIPVDRPCILAPNHASYLDPPALAAVLGWRRLHRTYWGGLASLLFAGPISRLLSRAAHILPVDPDRAPLASLSMASTVLARGDTLVWFPEGERSPTGEFAPFRSGIGLIAAQTGVPLVPVAIHGTFQAWPADRRLPRPRRLKIAFGEPVSPDHLARRGNGATEAERIANALQDTVAALYETTARDRVRDR